MLKKTKCYIRNCSKRWEEIHKKTTRYRRRCASVVSMITGIPVHKVSENENKKLSKMRDAIEGKVIGQDDAVANCTLYSERTCWYERSKQTYLQWNTNWNSGVGKTELAKQLAKYLFDSEDSLID
jgi:ATP-dependent Clp protease ATP-binding subunit ClpC